MSGTLPEKDWKYLRSIEKELLNDLCRKINQCAVEIVRTGSGADHEKYLALYKHIDTSDGIVGACFDDWRRSNLRMKLLQLQRHGLLSDQQILNLSDEARRMLGNLHPVPEKIEPADQIQQDTVELVTLSVKGNAAQCRFLGSDSVVTFRSSQLWELFPGEIAVVRPQKRWSYGGHPYLSGEIESARVDAAALGLVPLKLQSRGTWSPEEHYWGEEGEPIEEWAKPIIARGARQEYEMEQVMPGVDPDDWEADPISESNDLKEAGDRKGAKAMLMELCRADLRCLDAHAHLGSLAFDKMPEIALRHYEVGLRIGELSLGTGFNGLLPWGWIDNRPFLRCLHGYGITLWRLGRFSEALQVFVSMLWLNPSDNQGVRFLIEEVREGVAWRED